MKRLIVILLIATLFSGAAMAARYAGFRQVCEQGQACGSSCISKEQSCPLPLGWGDASDQDHVTAKSANKAKCCQGKQRAVGCAGGRVLCGDMTRSDVCGCQFSLIIED